MLCSALLRQAAAAAEEKAEQEEFELSKSAGAIFSCGDASKFLNGSHTLSFSSEEIIEYYHFSASFLQ